MQQRSSDASNGNGFLVRRENLIRVAKFVSVLSIAGFSTIAVAYEMPSDGVHENSIDWGLIMDMSGPSAAVQMPWVHGFQDHMRKVNEAGGINGRKINVLAEDDRYDASLHRIAFEKLSGQTPVLGVSGLGNSSAQATMMPMIRRGKVPVVGTYTTVKSGVEPASPMYYAGFCGYKEMAQVGVGYFATTLKTAPNVAVVHLDVASGKEYFDFIEAAAKSHGGSAKSLPIKVTAIDATPQVLEIMAQKPSVVALHGGPSTAILLMRTMNQYGLNVPTFAGTYQGSPVVYSALGPDAGKNYYFMSCLTPGGGNESGAIREMSATADKYGHGAHKSDVNYVGGWVVAETVAEAIRRAGPEPTRAKLVESMNKGLDVDTKGISAPIRYTPTDHTGRMAVRPYKYDYASKQFVPFGSYADYEKFMK